MVQRWKSRRGVMSNNKKIRVGLYARVSTIDKGQDPDLQLTPITTYCDQRGWNIVGRYVDYVTGATSRRPELDKLISDAKHGKLDVIVVWKLDRFGRSVQHLTNTITDLCERGVSFVSYMEALDFTTAAGKLMFNILAAFAQFERDIISDRVRAGLQNSIAKGVKVGRPRLTPGIIDRIRQKKEEGASYRTIARELGVSVGSLSKALTNR